MDVRDRLRWVFVATFDLAPDIDIAEVRHRTHARWDSLGHMALVVAIEDEFGVEFDTEQLLRMDSFETALEVLHELGVRDST